MLNLWSFTVCSNVLADLDRRFSMSLLILRLFFVIFSVQINVHEIVPIYSNFVNRDSIQFILPFDTYVMMIVSILSFLIAIY